MKVKFLKKLFSFLALSFFILMPLRSQDTEANNIPAIDPLEYFSAAGEYFETGQFEKVRSAFNEFYIELKNHPKKYPADDWVESCYKLSVSIYRGRQRELLVDILDPIVSIDPVIKENRIEGEFGKLINLVALALKNQGYIAESIPIYLRAMDYLNKCNSLPASTLPDFYINLGNAFRSMGDLSQADKYYNEALRKIELHLGSLDPEDETIGLYMSRKATVLNSIGLTYQLYGHHQMALETFQESLEISKTYSKSNLPRVNNNIGVSYKELKDYENALMYYKKAISFFEPEGDLEKNSSWVLYSLNSSDILSTDTTKSAEAEKSVENVLKNMDKIDDIPDNLFAMAYYQLGTIKTIDSLYLDGIRNIDKGLSYLTGIQPNEDNLEILSVNLNNSPEEVIDGIKYRARSLKEWGKDEGDTYYQYLALENFKIAELCIDSLRSRLEGEESKIALSNIEQNTYSEKMDLIWELYSADPKPDLIAEAFESIEKGKAAGLWNIIQLEEEKQSSLPPEIIKLDDELRQTITELNNKIISLELSNASGFIVDSVRRRKFSLESSLDSLTNSINENYPEYNTNKFRNEILSLEGLQRKIKSDQVIIQYYYSASYLIKILIEHNSARFEVFSDPAGLTARIKDLNNRVKLSRHDYSRDDVINYHKVAWSLYQDLLESFESRIEDKEIIILPDDYLSLIPFEALVTSGNMASEVNFKKLKYLIQDNQISYSYNASLWAYENANRTEPGKLIYGTAPSYSVSGMDTSSIWKNWKPLLPELSGTHEEIRLLKDKYRATTFTNSRATEEKFKNCAPDYKILHLAMHTLVDPRAPENAFLAFTPLADQTEDGRLYSNEVRNLKLNSSLTILSACNTGTGELITGEGVMSLSRMFLLAGSSSLIMTLWPVDDQAGLKIIDNFYQEMSMDISVAKALQSSKKNFLNEASKLQAHPYFWAGFIHLGKDTNIRLENKTNNKPWLIGAIALACLILLYTVYKITKPR